MKEDALLYAEQKLQQIDKSLNLLHDHFVFMISVAMHHEFKQIFYIKFWVN